MQGAPGKGIELPEPAEELQRLKSHFLAGLNHEIRTPLSGILGMSDLLLETSLDDLQREYVATARICAEELLELLNSALEFSAVSTGGLTLEDAEFNLDELLKGVVDGGQIKAHARGLRLTANLENLPLAVMGDATRLRHVLAQLIGNAIKFTPRGEIHLSAQTAALPEGRCLLQVSVRDTGIGIPPDQLKHLFESFRQLEGGLGRRFSGLGLGLALVQQLVCLMGGDVTAESQQGRGSLFTITVPLRLAHELAVGGAAKDLRPSEQAEAAARILLVDDDVVAQRIVAHMLARGRFRVDAVPSGEAALAAAGGRRYDLILMDLQMPGMDGIETASLIRQLPAYAAVPIIALTAHTGEEYRAFCREQGFEGFLSKPVRSEELVVAVAQHIHA
ncbi:MAG: ATP-binding protein [Acidobacteriota bacterium]